MTPPDRRPTGATGSGPVRVGLLSLPRRACAGILAAALLLAAVQIVATFAAFEPGSSGWDTALTGVSRFSWAALLVVTCLLRGRLEVGRAAIEERSWFGVHQMRWSEVQRVEHDAIHGTITLCGPAKEFVIAPAAEWFGPGAGEALALVRSATRDLPHSAVATRTRRKHRGTAVR